MHLLAPYSIAARCWGEGQTESLGSKDYWVVSMNIVGVRQSFGKVRITGFLFFYLQLGYCLGCSDGGSFSGGDGILGDSILNA